MSGKTFSFKQFSITQERAAMKVGTDGVLLGAWADTEALSGPNNGCATPRRLLDVGCGTGVIALMLAQRTPQAVVDAIDLDEQSCAEAAENVARSPWGNRIRIHHTPLQKYTTTERYTHIISNPPYFLDSLHAPERARNQARHATTLTYEELIASAERLLTPGGRLSVILPVREGAHFCALIADCAAAAYLVRRTEVYAKAGGPLRRVLLEFCFGGDNPRPEPPPKNDALVIETGERHHYTPAYKALTGDFYLKF